MKRSISSILGIEDISHTSTPDDLYCSLGLSIINKIINDEGFTPVIIDMAVQAKNKWTAMAFSTDLDTAKDYLTKYISSVRTIITQRRSILLHPDFQSKAEIVFCSDENFVVSEATNEEVSIDAHIKEYSTNALIQYVGDIFKSTTYDADTNYSPEDNASYLYSLFCQLTKSQNYVFVSIPVTRRVVDEKKELKRELMGGVFLVLQRENKTNDVKRFDSLILKIITTFYKGLIDWHQVKDTIENCGVEKWIELRKKVITLCLNNDIDPHHLPHGKYGDINGSYDENIKNLFINSLKSNGVKYINDIDLFKNFDWNEQDKKTNGEKEWKPKLPPIRAIAQYDSNAKDFSIFMELLQKDLSSHFSELDIYFKQMLPVKNEADYLWFNPVPLGMAIYKICKGLSELKDGSNNFIFSRDNKARVDIVYGSKEVHGKTFLYFNIYEYGASNEILYKKDCWSTSINSLKSAGNNLYICGVRCMFYSGFDGQNFKTQKITLNCDPPTDYTCTYSKQPPFLSFGIVGENKRQIEINNDIFLIEVNLDQNNTLDNFFKMEFCNENNSY